MQIVSKTTAKQFSVSECKFPQGGMCVHLYTGSDCGNGNIPVSVLQRADMIYGKGFSWRFIATGYDPPHPEIIGNVSCLISCENTTVSACSQKSKLKVFVFLNLEMLRCHFVIRVSLWLCEVTRRASSLTCGFRSCHLSPNHCNYSSNTSLFVCLLK